MITAPTTVTELAQTLGVNRRRIAKWREAGAPADLDLIAWRQFLKDAGKTKILARLDTTTAPLDGLAPETAAAATDSTAADDAQIDAPEVPRPLPDAGPAAWEKYYKARGNRQTALNAERQALKDSRELVPQDEVIALLRAMASAQLEAMGDSIWLALRPHLDGVPDTLRKTLRTAHDQSLLAVRARLAVLLREKFSALTNPPAKPA